MRRYPHPRWERSFVQAGQTLSAEYLDERVSESFVQGTLSCSVCLCICIRSKHVRLYWQFSKIAINTHKICLLYEIYDAIKRSGIKGHTSQVVN